MAWQTRCHIGRRRAEVSVTRLCRLVKNNGVKLFYIQPGKPNQNAYIERFNRTCQHEGLNAYAFE